MENQKAGFPLSHPVHAMTTTIVTLNLKTKERKSAATRPPHSLCRSPSGRAEPISCSSSNWKMLAWRGRSHGQGYFGDGAGFVGVEAFLVRQAGREDLRGDDVGNRGVQLREVVRQPDHARGARRRFGVAGVGDYHGFGLELVE